MVSWNVPLEGQDVSNCYAPPQQTLFPVCVAMRVIYDTQNILQYRSKYYSEIIALYKMWKKTHSGVHVTAGTP